VSHSFSHHIENPATVSQINLPTTKFGCHSVFLSGDRLYAKPKYSLYVYSVSDHKSPIATYQLKGLCSSGIITDNHLYLSDFDRLYVFEVTTSVNQPLLTPKIFDTKKLAANKMLRVQDEIILAGFK
jgi:hypothetical protein